MTDSVLLSYLTDRKGFEPEEVEASGLAIRREGGGYYTNEYVQKTTPPHVKAAAQAAIRQGAAFVDYYCRIKEAEVARFNLEVSDWEHREYFDLF